MRMGKPKAELVLSEEERTQPLSFSQIDSFGHPCKFLSGLNTEILTPPQLALWVQLSPS
ncbi:hypothetical protein PTE30175_02214 [Pandoraea terrae]|uniref:Uncharacterized protein n=1 Tax=Pandoraea terrae TaxID=1537710 RepID=A0A5E4UVF2_9BURK|nr:hypothetical protein PTE30175_02214 [Pandoraea terrae]